ncbi:uncharacterized protein [Oscarella lobularis]|uniref:uncharacterized protein n=1 Tax=Oscarella lobularis TaxID=121494 RepID=UPI0033132B44
MPQCLACQGSSFTLIDGLYFCNDCGTQCEDIQQEEEHEYHQDEGTMHRSQIQRISMSQSQKEQLAQTVTSEKKRAKMIERNARRIARRKREYLVVAERWKKIKNQWEQPKERKAVERLEYREYTCAEVYQALLKAQVKALLKMGFSADLKGVVGQLWFSLLRHCKDAFMTDSDEESLAAKEKFREKRQQASKEEEEEEEEDNEDEEEMKNSTDFTSKSCLRYFLQDDVLRHCQSGDQAKLNVLTGLCYVGLICVGEAVLEKDLIRWIQQGRFPYLNFTAHLPKDFNPKPLAALANPPIPSVKTLFSMARALVSAIGLPKKHIPMIDSKSMCQRFARDLVLPGVVLRVLFGLLRIHLPDCRRNLFEERSVGALTLPYVAILCVATKLCFRLDDEFEYRAEGGALTATSSWLGWLRRLARRWVERHRIKRVADLFKLGDDLKLYSDSWDLSISEKGKDRNPFSEIHDTKAAQADEVAVEVNVNATSEPFTVAVETEDPVDLGAASTRYVLCSAASARKSWKSEAHSVRLLIAIGSLYLGCSPEDLHRSVSLQETELSRHLSQ